MVDAEPGTAEAVRLIDSDPPRTPQTLVARSRLYGLLDQSTQAPLTMVVSPAGTGKTVLLSAWSAQLSAGAGAPVLWLAAHDHASLDRYLLLAAGLGSDPEPAGATSSVLELISAALDGHEPSLLIIDDAHLLPAVQVHTLAEILRKAPDAVRLVLASRRDLALPLVELELRAAASTIRATQLRFAADEATELIRAHAGDATADELRALQEESRGWAAALVLGARRLKRSREPGAAPPSLARADQPVLDFLLGDAFTSLPKRVRDVLLTTFAEPVITVERAAVLSGNRNAGALLSELVSEGLLVTAYVQGRARDAVFRYHPLLVELLRRRVISSRGDAAVAAGGHRRAALHDAALGNRVSALQQAIASGDDELLVRLVIEFAPTLLCAGQHELLTAVLARLPGDALDRFPLLLGVAGQQRRAVGDIPGADLLASRAAEAVGKLGRPGTNDARHLEDAFRADTLQLQIWQARSGWQDGSAAISNARMALGCRHTSVPASTHNPEIAVGPERLAVLLIELAAAEMWEGDLRTAELHINEAVVHGRATGHAQPLADALSHRAVLELVAGAVRTAETTAKHALRLAEHQEPSTALCVARARMVVAWAAFYRLDFHTAGVELARLDDRMPMGVDAIVETQVNLLHASLLSESGCVDEARRRLSTAPEAPGRLPEFLVRALALKRWHCASLADDSATASAQIAVLAGAGCAAEVVLLQALSERRSERGSDAIAQIDGVLEELSVRDPILAAAAATGRLALLLQTGDRSAARMAVVDVLSRVAPQQTTQTLTAGGIAMPVVLDLLHEESRRADAHTFAAPAWTALSRHGEARYGDARYAFEPLPGGASAATAGPHRLLAPGRSSTTVRPSQQAEDVSLAGFPIRLTARETDVLEQLALGSSYTEIGRTLFITENTVKTHLASLYRKLAVDKRSAALRVARGLGLL